MQYIADLHLHSRYSRATSKMADLEGYYAQALIKGIHLLGTGDFTHPEWVREMKEKLIQEESGFFSLKEPPPQNGSMDIKYCLSAEISSIYKKNDRTRKIHSLVLAPDFESVEKVNAKLNHMGFNIKSDGRPILGMDARDLMDLLLSVDDRIIYIPAHIWTPWFSVFGSKSGFDRIEECYEELTDSIFALETGLSSDPLMNSRLSALDRFTLVSNSDAHSPSKLGREANLFDTDFSYEGMYNALKTKKGFNGTIEFFPEEGKYHLDGHRKCGICLEPEQTLKQNGICPECGKPLTIGVMHRVLELSDRSRDEIPVDLRSFKYVIPLAEIIAEIKGKGSATQAVLSAHERIIQKYGTEFGFLLEIPIHEIQAGEGEMLAEAVKRMRSGLIKPQPGFDGEFGVIRVFTAEERAEFEGQKSFFSFAETGSTVSNRREKIKSDNSRTIKQQTDAGPIVPNETQDSIIKKSDTNIIITAGPGTGKTWTLVNWIMGILKNNGGSGHKILAITFTNKAAREMEERVFDRAGIPHDLVHISTFHSFCYELLTRKKNMEMTIISKPERAALINILFKGLSPGQRNNLVKAIESANEKQEESPEYQDQIRTYENWIRERNCIDISALISEVNKVFEEDTSFLEELRNEYTHIAVDEVQDINEPQYRFLKHLMTGSQSLFEPRFFLIGDPDQAIYGFRGSNFRLLGQLKRERDFEEAALNDNYRSTPIITEAASALISHNRERSGVVLKSRLGDGDKIEIKICRDTDEEAKFIANTIDTLVGGTLIDGKHTDRVYSFSDFAVLARTRNVLCDIMPLFTNYGIPSTFQTNQTLFSRPPMSHVLVILKLIQNPMDPVSLNTLLDIIPQCGDRDAMALNNDTTKLLESTGSIIKTDGIKPAIDAVIGFLQSCGFSFPELMNEREPVLELAGSAGNDLKKFLTLISLSPNESETPYRSEKVKLLTFHAAKGLEFPIIFLAGVEDGITPLLSRKFDIEEERRLFYVALTRAKEKVYMTASKARKTYGKEEKKEISRFLVEIPEKYRIIINERKKMIKAEKDEGQLLLF
ncbi:MAG: UvrD-helicase domain-containing protein [Spirochaetales bacterium]|nr:UvrD-helicase domain-containing protein [Spirochaetales bacterium]